MTASLTPNVPGSRGLVNLAAELEDRLGGAPVSSGFDESTSALLPSASGYVLVVFDGLGSRQLDIVEARELAACKVDDLIAPFPTTTTVSLASIATGLSPARHGLVGYQLYLPHLDVVANTIKWTTLWGDPVELDYRSFLPETVWERLSGVDIDTVTVQPANFAASPLTQMMYRGARFESVTTVDDWVEACLTLAKPGRLIVAYLPHVDVSAHMTGQGSVEYRDAVALIATAWERLRQLLRSDVGLLGTADHGHVDIPPERQIQMAREDQAGRVLFGDSRVMFINGPPPEHDLPATYHPFADVSAWWGAGPPLHPERFPDGVLVADDGHAILHRFSDKRMIGHHGGVTDAERLVPLLVR
ncbi:MAG: hypothetical protein HKO76_08005 [Acidimicrobiia bacterium]|nr:hypothetical protein [Acidimicrobiia bacterium]